MLKGSIQKHIPSTKRMCEGTAVGRRARKRMLEGTIASVPRRKRLGYVCSSNRHYIKSYGMDNGRAPNESKNNERSTRRGKGNCRRKINGYRGYAPSNELREISNQRDYEVTSSSSITCSRESTKSTKIYGYDIPAKTRVIVNAWAIGRDLNHGSTLINFNQRDSWMVATRAM
ncbi:cytochrome P450 93A3-like protein [Cinnamomum micranthum f. kanehirae]|uniref:Cytochrome P450 93A3-like protein n=1 Tax=Cinnamomum micranthum f. kanehirae TaxID=337451 RepID=A0A3S3QZL1_9MAGN|nr:cytochrome P450 93A3-like protein [Cinnamomum micranthum f. kanehirae]